MTLTLTLSLTLTLTLTPSIRQEENRGALHQAAYRGDVARVKELVNNGVNVDAQDPARVSARVVAPQPHAAPPRAGPRRADGAIESCP